MAGDLPTAPKSPRGRQFSLRTLLVGAAIFAATLGCLMVSARRQAHALRPLRAHGAIITYNYDAPEWTNELIGDDFFSDVVGIDLSATRITDKDLRLHIPTIQSFHSLGWINLTQPELSDKVVAELAESLPGVLVIHPSIQNSKQ